MTAKEDACYRLRLAEGFYNEARQDMAFSRWRSCVDNSQLSVENSAKTILAIFGPVERSHAPSKYLKQLIEGGKLDQTIISQVVEMLPLVEELGAEEHFMTDYGDEESYRVPWEIFKEEDAKEALAAAEKCLKVAKSVFGFYFPNLI